MHQNTSKVVPYLFILNIDSLVGYKLETFNLSSYSVLLYLFILKYFIYSSITCFFLITIYKTYYLRIYVSNNTRLFNTVVY